MKKYQPVYFKEGNILVIGISNSGYINNKFLKRL